MVAAPDQMMVLTRRAAEKAYERFAETGYWSKLMRKCCAGGVGLASRASSILVSYRSLANYARWRLALLKALPVSMGCL